MKAKLFITTLSIVVLTSWGLHQKKEIIKAQWLIGTWENKTSRGSIFETWIKINDDEFFGKSYVIKENDTIVYETIRLVQEKEGLFYIPTVKNQNEGLPVRFALKSISDTGLVFENQLHDFPQIISYTKKTSDSLVAEISGLKNGQERKIAFPMKRTK